MKKIFLIDANAVAYRAFFAIKSLSTSYGQPTNAVYGFLNILNKIVREMQPDYLLCAFDSPGGTFRHRMFADYKIQRPGMPENLVSQLPLIKEVLDGYHIPILEQTGLEADDLLVAAARQAAGKDMLVYVVTADKDLLQIVSDRIQVLHPQTYEIIDRAKAEQKFGLPPEKIPDLMALTGDSTDNIPGVKGLGEKTAAPLIQRFGSLENLYEHLAEVPGEALRRKLTEGRESAFLSKKLADLLSKRAPEGLETAAIDLEAARFREPDKAKLAAIFRRLEFRKLLKDVDEEPDLDYLLLVSAGGAAQNVDFTKLLRDPAPYLPALASPDVVKAGPELKEKLHRLHGRISPPPTSPARGEDSPVSNGGGASPPSILPLEERGVSSPSILPLDGGGKVGVNVSPPFFDFGVAATLCEKQAPPQSLPPGAGTPISDWGGGVGGGVEETLRFYKTELETQGMTRLFADIEMPLLPVIAGMEESGIYLNVPYLKDLARHFGDVLKNLETEIFRLAGMPFNLNSPQQLAQVLFEELKLPTFKKTKSGFSTDISVLTALAPFHPIIPAILKYRQTAKLNSTYVLTLPELVSPEDGRLHTTFNQIGAVTGRLSSEKPNLQNIPVETAEGASIRRAFCVPDEENIFLSLDYSQIELRVLAHLSGDRNLIEAFREDRDIHDETARAIFRKTPPLNPSLSPSGRGEVRGNEVTPAERRSAKIVNFGIIYGMSAYGLSQQLTISPAEAQQFIDAYFEKYSGVKEFLEKVLAAARTDGYVTTLLGRRRSIPEINSRRPQERALAERAAVNTPVQGSAADIIKLAMLHCHDFLTKSNARCTMLLQIHDELLFETPRREKAALIPQLKDAMERAGGLSVPVKVSAKSGPNWQDLTAEDL